MNYSECAYVTDVERCDAVLSCLAAYGIDSVSIEDYHDLLDYTGAYPPELVDADLLQKQNEPVVIRCYFEEGTLDLSLLRRVEQETGATLSVQTIAQQDWENNWKQYYRTSKVGQRLWIKPTWEPMPHTSAGEVVLELDPGMAFGTGTHETTVMCLEGLEDVVRPGCCVLDVGCGSGILGIAAIKLGAACATGVDLDEKSVETAAANAKINQVDNRFSAVCGNLVDHLYEKFDIIVVNIVADAIIELISSVRSRLSQNGALLLSGIINTREADVRNALAAAGFTVTAERRRKDWVFLRAE